MTKTFEEWYAQREEVRALFLYLTKGQLYLIKELAREAWLEGEEQIQQLYLTAPIFKEGE